MFLNWFNLTVGNGINLCVLAWINNYHFSFVNWDPKTIPDLWTTACHLFILFNVEDFCFYWTHRAAHFSSKSFPLYQWIHKIHHSYHNPIVCSAVHAHPLEYMLTNHLPHFAGMFLLGSRLHLSTIIIFGRIRGFETLDGHSGYQFPWSPVRLLPFSCDTSYHDFHHSQNVGNFGAFTFLWDTIFDTNSHYFLKYPVNSRLIEKVKQD